MALSRFFLRQRHRTASGRTPRRLLAVGALLAVVSLTAGCSELGYYWQAGTGQLEILRKRRPIDQVLADPAVDATTKAKLRLVLEAQTFATASLDLPAEAHYESYADLGRPQVTWLVVASEALAFTPHQSCFPIAGCFDYRGYFAREDAEAFATTLREQDYDVTIRPVRAYSTLGWFDDPVLNTFLRGTDAELAGTIIHEMAHRRYYLDGDTTFNESYASFVEQAGVARFLADWPGADAEALERFRRKEAERERFRQIVLAGKARLETLYASDLPPERKRARKAELLARLKRDYQKARSSFTLLSYDGWFEQELNNAHLLGFSQYRLRVDAFRALFNRHDRDFARFHQAVAELGDLPAQAREAALDDLERSP